MAAQKKAAPKPTASHAMPEVPKQIFEHLLQELSGTDIPAATIERLKAVLLGDQPWSIDEVRTALFKDGTQ